MSDYQTALENLELSNIDSKGKWLKLLDNYGEDYWIPDCHRGVKVNYSMHTVKLRCHAEGCPNYMVIG